MLLKINIFLFLLLCTATAFAGQLDKFSASVGANVTNSNNIFLSHDNPKSDNIFRENFNAKYSVLSPRLEANFTLDASHEHYENHSFVDRNVITSVLTLNSTLVKNKLTWLVENRFSPVTIDSTAKNLPTNQENANSFSTGPDFMFFKNNRQSLNLSLRYSKLNTQSSDINNYGYTSDLFYKRRISRTFSIKLDVTNEKKYYADTSSNKNYTRTDSIITFSKRMKLASLDVGLGNTVIYEDNSTKIEHGIFRTNYNYKFAPKANLNLSYSRELGNFTGMFSNLSPVNAGLPAVGSQIFLVDQGALTIQESFGKSRITYGYTYFNTEYAVPALGVNSKRYNARYSNELSPFLSLNLDASYERFMYSGKSREDTQRTYTAGLTQTFLGEYGLSVEIHFINRSSNDSIFDYNERGVSVGGNYYF